LRQIRVYVDNSVFGGVFDDEFAEDSKRFFQSVRSGKYKVLACKVQQFNAVNLASGYGLIDIPSPKEIGYGDED
jgi:hypothetical protein